MLQRTIKKGIAVVFSAWSLLVVSPLTWAELQAIDDEEMSNISGQAYISIDQTTNPVDQNVSYTRINMGMDIEAKLNADKIDIGRYDRAGEKLNSSDILINDFGLGYIQDSKFFQNQSFIPSMRKPGGGTYKDGEVVPFNIKDPYLEFARDETTGQLIGVRLGFGEAQGLMTGNIEYLTGALDVDIRDNGKGLKAASSSGNPYDKLLTKLAPLMTSSNSVNAQAQLVNAQGELDPVRAEYVGMPNGTKFTIQNVSFLVIAALAPLKPALSSDISWHRDCPGLIKHCGVWDIDITSNNCSMLGVKTCFPFSNFQTLPVGKIGSKDGKPVITGPASGMFLSFQTKDLLWSKTARGVDAASAKDFINATQGAFFNIPSGAVEVNLSEVYKGTPAVRQEFIDRGLGLF